MSIRTERVGRLLQRELASLLQNEFSTEVPGLVTITRVRVTADLGIAYVYVSILDSSRESKEATYRHLVSLVPRIRSALASKIRHQVRKVAELRFFMDESLDKAARMEELFERINNDGVDRNESDD